MKTRALTKNALPIFLWLAFVLAMARPTFAVTLTVASTNDNGAGSLRQAMQTAAPGDTINFLITGTITLTSGELLIATNLSIVGPGAGSLTVMRSSTPGTPSFRIFNIAGGTVSISGVTISNGLVVGATGSGAFPPDPGPGGSGGSGSAGGILNQATLFLANCAINGNSAVGGAGGFGTSGGSGHTLVSATGAGELKSFPVSSRTLSR